jgi:sugar transferase (PEP-CTERM/EpsH1 system associated)
MDFGGLERVVLDLIREGQKRGQRVTVVCLERPGVLAPQVEALGASLHCVHKRPGLVRVSAMRRLKVRFREIRPEVVHTHQIGALLYAGPAARAGGIPLVVHTEHGKHYAERRRNRWLGKLAGHFAARFFCVSEDIATEVRACGIVPDRKVVVVSNGIDTARFRARRDPQALRASLGIPPGAPVVGTIGRLCEVKTQDVLLRAFVGLRKQVPEVRLVLVGDGPLMGELRGLAANLGLEPCVSFVGYQAQPERFLDLMDVFALTSRSEGMPLSVLEAWAAGVPVVASRVGGLPELIEDGRNGLLFPAGDEAALVEALRRLIVHAPLARQLGETGRLEVEARFSLDRMADDYQRHYFDLLRQKKAAV